MTTGVKVAGLALVLSLGCGRIAFDPFADPERDAGVDADDGTDADPRAWWDPKWKRRIKLELDNPGAALVSFQVLVRLDSTRIDYADTEDTGADLRFVDADGTSRIPHEIERWNENGSSVVWVRVPQIDSPSDHIWLYFGNPVAIDAATPASVWSGSSLVWHLSEIPGGTAPQIRDVTANGNHGTLAGGIAAPAQNSGVIGGSLSFDGVDDWITAPHDPSLQITGDLTISAWVSRMPGRSEWICDFVTPASEDEVDNHLYEISVDSSDRFEAHWEFSSGQDTDEQSSVSLSPASANWNWLSVTRDATADDVRFYENGVLLGTPQLYADDATGGTASTLWVAGTDDSTSSKQSLLGRLDELRIEPIARSGEWHAAQHRSMTDALITYGAVESY